MRAIGLAGVLFLVWCAVIERMVPGFLVLWFECLRTLPAELAQVAGALAQVIA